MPVLASPRHEAFAHALARGSSATAAYVEAGYKQNRHNAAALARKQHISTRVDELHEEQLAIHQQATAEAAANAQVTGRGCGLPFCSQIRSTVPSPLVGPHSATTDRRVLSADRQRDQQRRIAHPQLSPTFSPERSYGTAARGVC
jgi:hypothetical protein